MKVLITGGAGYFGGALAKALLERGYIVRIFDIQNTKYTPIGAEFYRGDVREKNEIESALNDIDIVFHLAFVQTPSNLPEEMQYQVNVIGTHNLLDASIGKGIKKLIFTSTIEVYGSRPDIPITEENKLIPVGIYSVHKLECEKLFLDYMKLYNLPCSIARLPLICGKGYYNHKPFLAMLDRIIRNKIVFLPAPGDILADMIHITDAINAMILLAEKSDGLGEIINFSASKPATHLEMAKKAIGIVDSKSKIVFISKDLVRLCGWLLLTFHIYYFPPEQIDYLLNDFVCDNSKAHQLLGYEPTYSVVDAIGNLIQGYSSDRDFIKNRKIGSGLSNN